jgi:hypothetical protein
MRQACQADRSAVLSKSSHNQAFWKISFQILYAVRCRDMCVYEYVSIHGIQVTFKIQHQNQCLIWNNTKTPLPKVLLLDQKTTGESDDEVVPAEDGNKMRIPASGLPLSMICTIHTTRPGDLSTWTITIQVRKRHILWPKMGCTCKQHVAKIGKVAPLACFTPTETVVI